MKVTYILPAIGKKEGQKYVRTWQQMEPLMIATLKELTPDHVKTEFYDDRIELIDYETETDLVAISVEVYTARRAYQIAAKFQKRGIPVIMGGYHTTLCPDEVAEHADSILIGNAETVWKEIINDFEKGEYQKRYEGERTFLNITPDRSIYRDKKYSPLGVIETGRGCNHACEFCAITSSYNAHYHRRPIEDIVREIKETGKKLFFFVDDNIVADHDYAIKLFKAIAPLNIKWTGQGTLTMAKDEELLKWMKKSGCQVILIGYESLEESNLEQMNKGWSSKLGYRNELTQRIHDYGINIYATFVFGFDNDTVETFDRTLEFALEHDFFFAAFNHLLPMPGTELYRRLKEEGRLIDEKWWLNPEYRYGEIPFCPEKIDPELLADKCTEARREFFKLSSIFKRSISLLKRDLNPALYYIFWNLNLKLQKEVAGKRGLPLGEGLDELPK